MKILVPLDKAMFSSNRRKESWLSRRIWEEAMSTVTLILILHQLKSSVSNNLCQEQAVAQETVAFVATKRILLIGKILPR